MNIIERLINITVDNGDANKKLNSTSDSLVKVDKNATKVTQTTKTMTKETSNHTQSLVANGGAMGILNELTGGLAMTFKDAGEAIGLAGVSLNSFKGIMIATGIGALVIAVGALAANWEAVAEFLHITNKEQDDYIAKQNIIMANSKTEEALLSRYVDIVRDGTKSILERQAALDKIAEKVTALRDLKIGIDQGAINSAIESYTQLNRNQAELKDRTDEYNKSKLEEQRIQSEINGISRNASSYEIAKRKDLNKELDKQMMKSVELFNGEKGVNGVIKDGITILQSRIDKSQAELKIATNLGEKNKKNSADKVAIDAKNKSDTEASLARLEALRLANNRKLTELDDITAIDKLNRQEQYAIRELDLVKGNEKDKQVVRTYYARLRAEEEDKISKAYRDKLSSDTYGLIEAAKITNEGLVIEEQLTADAKLESWMNYWDNVYSISETSQQFLSILQDESLIKSKEVRTAMLLLEKGLAIAGVWINEAQSTAMATAGANAVPTTTNIPGPYGPITIPNPMKPVAMAGAVKAGITNKINAGIATASILAQTIASFGKSGGGGNASGGGGAAAPQAQFNIVGSSGTNQLAATIGAQQNQPVNAYVVGTDVSTQQALDRNIVTNATFL